MSPRLLAFAALVAASPLHAHITMTYPPPRVGPTSPIGTPCGLTPDPGRLAATPMLPGSTIIVRWNETIDHPGHFRISFDDKGQDGFVDPASYTDYYNSPTVLLDAIVSACAAASDRTASRSAPVPRPWITVTRPSPASEASSR